jgi:DNA polymerase III subunit gamma/tau
MADPRSDAPSTGRFLVSARKYRPQTFADLVSQEHVTGTLQNALCLDRLAHAYLFSGPRGVGKTTAARLLAKAINCQTPLESRESAEPCRTCDACRSFEEGRSLNVVELDAASNNGVDDIRTLRDNVLIPPQGARRKVYIVDEVHMLSTAAFNALLKTLEEPPAHALFIFATTEPHKVLPTILSRCQRFDFRRITVEETVTHLRAICEAEGITADEGALHLLARRGDGALRDALSIFDQAVALCGSDLRYGELAEALGVVDRDLYFEVSERARARDTASLLRTVDAVVRRGYDLQEFAGGLAEHLRHLYVVVSTGEADLIEADAETRGRYLAAARDLAEPDLLRALTVIDDAERELKHSPQPRLKLELALLKLAHLEGVSDLRALIERLDRMEAGLPSEPRPAPPPSARTAEPSPPYAPPPQLPRPPAGGSPPPVAKPSEASPSEASPSRPEAYPAPEPSRSEAPPPEPPADEDPPEPPGRPEPPRSAPPGTPEPAPPEGDLMQDLFGAPALRRRRDPGGESGDGAAATAQLAPARPAQDPHFGLPLGRVRETWPQLVRLVQSRRPSVATVLSRAEPSGVQGGAVQIAVPDAFTQRLLRDEHEAFVEALREVLGEEPPPFAFVVEAAPSETPAEADPFEALKRLRHEHPLLRVLFERFGAEIVWT